MVRANRTFSYKVWPIALGLMASAGVLSGTLGSLAFLRFARHLPWVRALKHPACYIPAALSPLPTIALTPAGLRFQKKTILNLDPDPQPIQPQPVAAPPSGVPAGQQGTAAPSFNDLKARFGQELPQFRPDQLLQEAIPGQMRAADDYQPTYSFALPADMANGALFGDGVTVVGDRSGQLVQMMLRVGSEVRRVYAYLTSEQLNGHQVCLPENQKVEDGKLVFQFRVDG